MPTTPAQRKATTKYLQTLDEIRIRMPKGQKEVIQARAQKLGKSVNAYVLELIDKDLNENP